MPANWSRSTPNLASAIETEAVTGSTARLRATATAAAASSSTIALSERASATPAAVGCWQDYLSLCKPRVVSLVTFTALASMCLAAPQAPLSWSLLLAGSVGVMLAAASAAVLNQVADRDIDALMRRTRGRPLPSHRVGIGAALAWAAALGGSAMLLLGLAVNLLTAGLALVALIGYAVVYTRWLKWSTPQNIVLGGAAGAAPTLIGWTAATGSITPGALALFLIVFVWTPAHFWPLAIARRADYAAAAVPMLPLTHGLAFTQRRILAYAIALLPVSLMPWVAGVNGPLYAIGALLLGTSFIRRAAGLRRQLLDHSAAMALFRWSISYLSMLFALMLLDRWLLHLMPMPSSIG